MNRKQMMSAGVPEASHTILENAAAAGIPWDKLLQAFQLWGPTLLQILAFFFQPQPAPVPVAAPPSEAPTEE